MKTDYKDFLSPKEKLDLIVMRKAVGKIRKQLDENIAKIRIYEGKIKEKPVTECYLYNKDMYSMFGQQRKALKSTRYKLEVKMSEIINRALRRSEDAKTLEEIKLNK